MYMKDTKEIVLFFKDKQDFSPLDVSKELMGRYPELGEPIILPDNGVTKAPLVLFNTNSDFQMQISRISLNFVVNHTYFKKMAAIIFDIVDAFESFDAHFFRLGYISSIFFSPNYIEKAKKRFLNMDNLEGIQDFHISWYKELENSCGVINCWERVITDHLDFPDLLMQYDFNSPIDIDVDFEMKYIKEFLKTTDEYIEGRTDF